VIELLKPKRLSADLLKNDLNSVLDLDQQDSVLLVCHSCILMKTSTKLELKPCLNFALLLYKVVIKVISLLLVKMP
jgi:hypothetical protein